MGHPELEAYYEALPEPNRERMIALRETIRAAIPEGFEETMQYGMPSWVVPHSVYPDGYHVNPELPHPFLSIGCQKAHIGVYHMGIYAEPQLLDWFKAEYPKHSTTRLDMGKSCIRLRHTRPLPLELLGELVSRMSPTQWIRLAETALHGRSS